MLIAPRCRQPGQRKRCSYNANRGIVAQLVLINGAPGSGKSTLARWYVEDHPLVLALDIDVVRAMLGGWLDSPPRRGCSPDDWRWRCLGFILQLEQLGDEIGADFVEVSLLSDPGDAADRFARRAAQPESAAHQDAAALLERRGGVDALPACTTS